MPFMQGQNPWAMVSSSRSSPLERASAVGELGGGGLDLSQAFSLGSSAAGGGGQDAGMMADAGGDDEGLSSISPLLIQMAQQQLGAMGDDTPTAEDKGLALAQAGFATAAGDSPNALQNFGAGAATGIQALQKAKQARAMQRMRESQIQQSGVLRQAALVDAAKQKAAALAQTKAIADEKAEQARLNLQAKKEHDAEVLADRQDRAAATAQAAQDRADALAETRYNQAASARLKDYNATGVWRKIAGDEDRGVSGAPTEDTYSGPLIDDPTVPLKERNKIKLAKPAQTQAVTTIDKSLENATKAAIALKSHPGLEGAVGFRAGQEYVPGTDAASFKANLNSLLSQQFAQAIQAMRDASKTGGAVGNVSDREGDRFESMVASLSQSQNEEQFRQNLDKVIEYGSFLKSTYADKYKSTYGEIPTTPDENKPGGVDGPSDDDLMKQYLPPKK